MNLVNLHGFCTGDDNDIGEGEHEVDEKCTEEFLPAKQYIAADEHFEGHARRNGLGTHYQEVGFGSVPIVSTQVNLKKTQRRHNKMRSKREQIVFKVMVHQ